MDAGLVVVSVVLGAFLLVPLAFAWLSTNPRRWARVERVLGRELPTGHDRVPPWLPWLALGLWAGLGAAYVAIGVVGARTPSRDGLPVVNLVVGVLWMLNGGVQFVIYRRRHREQSVKPQVQDRAEPGRPGAGG